VFVDGELLDDGLEAVAAHVGGWVEELAWEFDDVPVAVAGVADEDPANGHWCGPHQKTSQRTPRTPRMQNAPTENAPITSNSADARKKHAANAQ
jgi:hypothetical protein